MFGSERIVIQRVLAVYIASAGLGVEWEGFDFTPVKTQKWVSPQLIAGSNPSYSTVGSSLWVRRRNILQININTPRNFGFNPVEQLAEGLNALFQTPLSMDNGGVINFYPGSLKAAGVRDGFTTGILSIPYQVDEVEGAAVVIAPPSGDNMDFTQITPVSISGYMVVANKGTGLMLADSSDVSFAGSVLGITVAGATVGQQIQVRNSGTLQYNGWSWVLGKPVFLGLNGMLTQTPPTTGFQQEIGTPALPDTLLIEIDDPVVL